MRLPVRALCRAPLRAAFAVVTALVVTGAVLGPAGPAQALATEDPAAVAPSESPAPQDAATAPPAEDATVSDEDGTPDEQAPTQDATAIDEATAPVETESGEPSDDLTTQDDSIDGADESEDVAEADATDEAEAATEPLLEGQASLAGFRAGNIIDDAIFYNAKTMTAAQIQTFFNGKVATCVSGYTCLKDFRQTTWNKTGDVMCPGGYSGAKNETAAQIIAKVSVSCGINPQAIIVMLQKEQGLVTHVWPSDWRYDMALGQGCPDTAGCDPNFAGFFAQIYGAAWQMKRYANPPGTSDFFTWYAPGNTWGVRYNPNASCGSSPVKVENKATAALYYYTPYQPNAAALRAGYGEGDSCSAYGNRNFYNYFNDWFGPTNVRPFSSVPAPKISGQAVVGQTLTATASGVSPAPSKTAYQWLRDGKAISGATKTTYVPTTADVSRKVSARMTVSRTGYTTKSVTSATVTPVAAPSTNVDRLFGENREVTAVQASRSAFPNGAKTVLLAASGDFADALTASALAPRIDASMLMTRTGGLPPKVSAELKRLAPSTVIIVGGTGAVSGTVVSQVGSAVPKAKITRLAGADRYETAHALLKYAGASATAYVATGLDFPDALSAAAAAGAKSSPVVLVDGSTANVRSSTIKALRDAGTKNLVIVGGTGVVSSATEKALRGQGFAVKRYGGADRYATNKAINDAIFGGSRPKAVAATGLDFPDALAGSALAGHRGVPLLLSKPTCMMGSTRQYAEAHGTRSLTLMGGPAVLSDAVARFAAC